MRSGYVQATIGDHVLSKFGKWLRVWFLIGLQEMHRAGWSAIMLHDEILFSRRLP